MRPWTARQAAEEAYGRPWPPQQRAVAPRKAIELEKRASHRLGNALYDWRIGRRCLFGGIDPKSRFGARPRAHEHGSARSPHAQKGDLAGRSKGGRPNEVAWRATNPEPGLRDPARAVELASGPSRAPKDGRLEYVGIARYRSGLQGDRCLENIDGTKSPKGNSPSWPWSLAMATRTRLGGTRRQASG
jgi:hypothetical protein